MRAIHCISWAMVAPLLVLVMDGKAARAQTQDHQYTAQDVEVGTRTYASQCALCHGPNGELVSGIDLRRGQFRKPLTDEELARIIVNGIAGTGMPPFAFQPGEITGLVAYIRTGFGAAPVGAAAGGAVRVGQTGRGQAVFEGKGGCVTCHRVNGKGARTAPDLSDIGSLRSAQVLQRKLADPTGNMFPINRPVRIVTRDGRTIHGRRLNEDTFTVQVLDAEGGLVSLEKSTLREYELAKTSPMPSVTGRLTSDEVADLIAYLLSLKG